jgi:hypothetical protein
MSESFYNFDAVNTINIDALKGGTNIASGGEAAASSGSAIPYQAIGEAIGLIISSSAESSVKKKMARLQEATGMAEIRWKDENEQFYRKLATASQKRDYMMKVVTEQIYLVRSGEQNVKNKKFRNTILIAVSLMMLGIAIPLIVKYSK